MFKHLLIWFLAAYSYDNMLKTYTSYTNENTFGEMKDFIIHQQEREDALREQCHLQFYTIPKSSYFEEFINTYLNKRYYISSKMEVKTKEELLTQSYMSENEGKDLVLEDKTFTLLKHGIKAREVYSYSNQMYEPHPRSPVWKLILDDITLTISSIN